MTSTSQNMSATHNSGATPTVAPSTAPKSSNNNSATKPPGGDTDYPEQIHAGAVGYGPNYHAGPTLAEKVQGLKDELKGKITHNPDLVQHGRNIMSGEEKRKKLTGEDEPNPFTTAKEDDSLSKDNAKGTSDSKPSQSHASSDNTQARHQSNPMQASTTDTQQHYSQSQTGTGGQAGLNSPIGLRDGKIQTMAGTPSLAPTTESQQPAFNGHQSDSGNKAPEGLNSPFGIRDGKAQTVAGSAGSVPQAPHLQQQNQTPAFDTNQQQSQSHGNMDSGLNGPIGIRDGKIQSAAGPIDSNVPQGIQSDRGTPAHQPYQTDTFGQGFNTQDQNTNTNSGSVPGIREGKVQIIDDPNHHHHEHDSSQNNFRSEFQSEVPREPAPTPASKSQLGSGLEGIDTQNMPKANPFGMAVNQGHGKGAMEQAATVAPEGTDEAERQRKGNNVDFMHTERHYVDPQPRQ